MASRSKRLVFGLEVVAETEVGPPRENSTRLEGSARERLTSGYRVAG
jgi:hypothetical protein